MDGDYVCALTTNFWRAGAPKEERLNVVMIVGATERARPRHGGRCRDEAALLLAWSALLRRGRRADGPQRLPLRPAVPRAPRAAARRGGALLLALWRAPGAARRAEAVQARVGGLRPERGHHLVVRGTVVMDTMQYLMQTQKLPLFNLNFVAKHFLGNSKTDLDIPTMFRLVEQRRFDRLISYVQRDGELVQEIVDNRAILGSVWEIAARRRRCPPTSRRAASRSG